YLNQLQPVIFNSRRRPDLVGQDSVGRWIVAESKGRTNDFDPQALIAAKVQTAAIRQVAGQAPFLRFALLSYFSSPDEYLAAHCLDPEEVSDDASDLMIERDQLFSDYYQPFLDLLSDQRTPANNANVSAKIPELDITVGMERRIYDLVRRRAYHDLPDRVVELRREENSIRRKTG